jgi:transposase-like protein
MDPPTQSCQNPAGPARGQVGRGNLRVHSWTEQRYRCERCGATFSARKGTAFYRLQTAADQVTLVLTRLCHGCPVQAIVAAFGYDERTIAHWLAQAGAHCQRVHEHLVQQGQVDRQPVQADELRVKLVGQPVWMALALAAPTRLWLGGVMSPQRDQALIMALVQQVRAGASHLDILVCVDGLSSYISALRRVFRDPVYTGRRGRPRLVLAAGFLLGQVVKQ